MLIFSPHNSNLCLESQETRFLWNIFEAVQETRSTCFIGIKTLGYASCFYTPIKHCCSFFKHYFLIAFYNFKLYIGRHARLWCTTIIALEMKLPREERSPTILRTLENLAEQHQKSLDAGGDIKKAKNYFNVIHKAIFEIPVEQVNM